jgi:hypothetical protein
VISQETEIVYEPAEGGYQPPDGGVSLRGFSKIMAIGALGVAIAWLLARLLGWETLRLGQDVLSIAFLIFSGLQLILTPDRFEDVLTDADRRSSRLAGIILIILAAVLAMLSFRTLFVPE